MSVPVDQLATATATVAMMFIGMRLLYGAWPWEAHKTWYRTRPLVAYVAALQRLRRELPERQVDSSETSNANHAGSPPSLQPGADTSTDTFDRNEQTAMEATSEVTAFLRERSKRRKRRTNAQQRAALSPPMNENAATAGTGEISEASDSPTPQPSRKKSVPDSAIEHPNLSNVSNDINATLLISELPTVD